MPMKAEMRMWGVNFQGPAALNKAATATLNKDKAVRVHKVWDAGGSGMRKWPTKLESP